MERLSKEKKELIGKLFKLYESRDIERNENFYNDRFDKLVDISENKLKMLLILEQKRG